MYRAEHTYMVDQSNVFMLSNRKMPSQPIVVEATIQVIQFINFNIIYACMEPYRYLVAVWHR